MRLRKLSQREMFVALAHPPGDAQADFGEALAVIGGEERKAHYRVIDLPQSDDCFVMAFPAETTEAFLEGHNQAFAYLGGVPRTILYDNTKIAVAQILGDGKKKKTPAFSELQSHYLFQERLGRPTKSLPPRKNGCEKAHRSYGTRNCPNRLRLRGRADSLPSALFSRRTNLEVRRLRRAEPSEMRLRRSGKMILGSSCSMKMSRSPLILRSSRRFAPSASWSASSPSRTW